MLRGPKNTLRLFREEDLEEFIRFSEDVMSRGDHFPITLRSRITSEKEFRETGWWEADQGRMLIVNSDNRLIGTIFFFKSSPYRTGYEIGYYIFRDEDMGKGYMSEALRIFSAYLFEVKEIPRLELTTAVDNAASARVAQKCGFQLDGVLRDYYFCRGQYQDCQLYSLLRSESPSLADAMRAIG